MRLYRDDRDRSHVPLMFRNHARQSMQQTDHFCVVHDQANLLNYVHDSSQLILAEAMNKELTGKTALITGASRGIGAATAIRLAQSGVTKMLLHYNSGRA